MKKAARTIAAMLLVGLWCLVVDAFFDDAWPSMSAKGWVVYWGGFVVIGLVADGIESFVRARKATAPEQQPGHETTR